MRISVAMATYNGERFIGEQLASLARQTLPPHELVVTDDGSTDRTVDVVKDFSRSAPFPVLFVRNDVNVGYTLNFLQAAAHCSGELLAFCDQDNIWMPHKLERCARVFRDQEIVLMVHSSEVIDETGAAVGQRLRPFRSSGKVSGWQGSPLNMIPPGCAMTLKRGMFLELWSAWPAHPHFEVREKHGNLFGHDTLTYCLARDRGAIYYEKEPLVLFRVHGGNTAAARWAFGSPRARVRGALIQSCQARASDYRRIAQCCADARLLAKAVCQRRRFPSLEHLQEIWGRTEENLCLRAGLYERRAMAYWACYIRMLARGSYGLRKKGGLGIRSALKDLAVGCLMRIALGIRLVGVAPLVSVVIPTETDPKHDRAGE
jgi:hypothetical protein